MSGGIPAITLPAGYLGSSFIGAALIACGFDINASKVACLVLAVFFLFTLWWARRNWLSVFFCLTLLPVHTSMRQTDIRISLSYSQNMAPVGFLLWTYRSILVCRRRNCITLLRKLNHNGNGTILVLMIVTRFSLSA